MIHRLFLCLIRMARWRDLIMLPMTKEKQQHDRTYNWHVATFPCEGLNADWKRECISWSLLSSAHRLVDLGSIWVLAQSLLEAGIMSLCAMILFDSYGVTNREIGINLEWVFAKHWKIYFSMCWLTGKVRSNNFFFCLGTHISLRKSTQ